MEVMIERLSDNGDGIGRVLGKVIFIPKTLPGDFVLAKIVKEYKNYIKGEVLEYLEYSDKRSLVSCPYYYECGGCQLMRLDYDSQLAYKKDKVINILKKYANIDFNPNIVGSNNYHYRNKITIQVKDGKMGLYKVGSNDLVSIDKCLLVSDNVNSLIRLIKDSLDLTGINQVVIREALNQLMVKFIGKIDRSILIEKILPCVKSLYLNDELLGGDECLKDKLGNYQFLISPNSFFQVNHNQTINLYNQVKKYLGEDNGRVMDLYCGTGSIGIYVSSCCKRVDGIEVSSSSVGDANNNILLNNLDNVFVELGDVSKVLEISNDYDAVIVDPPRSGLDKRTKSILKQMRCSKVIYVSCDPMTLARDLKELQDVYDVIDINLFDMFPNTYHVESVVLMKLENNF